ncbi:mucin-2-like isoform X2 [Halichondria panicea]|uniref:mucin-2-like isoform X2 n=1 Tax=Halichondria panicea TaxID=6063 RepID=UPI00312B9AFC
MSVTRKRALAAEGDGESSKDSKEKEKKSVRPPKPAPKKRRMIDPSDSQKTTAVSSGPSKGKRQAWTTAAIDAFYEGLLQHGKDFVKILKYMQSKQKKLNDPTMANLTKNQVRFFYYRNWHKVEPLLIHPQSSEPKKAGSGAKGISSTPQTPLSDFNEDSVLDDPHSTEGTEVKGDTEECKGDTESAEVAEGYLDSSMEEMDPASPVFNGSGGNQEQEVKSCPSPEEKVSVKDQVQASPTSLQTDKSEGKVKDTVMVNGTKQSLDLVALVCYNKLRKKNLGDHGISKRLSELVFHGVTSVPGRVKGKRKAQIRTPNCGAFRGPPRKPVSEDQPGEGETTPTVTISNTPPESALTSTGPIPVDNRLCVVELRPLTSSTWLHVQALSHNPRIRLHLKGSDTLLSLRDYLTLRWSLDKNSLNFYNTQTLDSSLTSNYRTISSQLSHDSHTLNVTASLPPTPQVDDHRDCLPATQGSEVTAGSNVKASGSLLSSEVNKLENADATLKPERSKAITEVDPCRDKGQVCSVDDRKQLGTEESSGVRSGVIGSTVKLASTWKELTVEGNSKPIQLSYEIQKTAESPDRLCAALKLVQFFLKKSPESSCQLTPVKRLPPLAIHRSPKVMEYIQSLRQSPHKSPLSKYRHLKTKSPFKQTTPSRVIKRVHLSFDTTDTTANSPATATSSCSTSSPKVLTLKVGNKTSTTQVVQLSSPQSIGSFANFKLQSLLPKPSPVPSPSTTPCLTPPTGDAVSSGCVLSSPAVPLIAATSLPPGVHRIQPRVAPSTPVTASPFVTLPNVPLVPKAAQSDGRESQPVVSIMSALKPFKKPKRIRKSATKSGQPHQLVPRPLPFLRNGKSLNGPSTTSPATTSTQVSTPVTSSPLTSPLTIATQHSSPRKTTATLIQNQQIMLQLLQSYMLQQQRVQLAQQASNHQLPTSQTTTAKQPAITTQASSSSHQNKEMDERDLHTSVLDNFLTEGGDKSTGVSNMFYTSSDTVNKLLQGLSSVKPSESIQKLSEETADVLPTFAKALGNSFLTSAGPSQESPPNEHPGDNEGDGTEHKDDQAGTRDVVPNSSPEDSQLPFLNDMSSTSFTDILGTLTDSNFKQVADNGDVFEHIDFTDMFTQLKDVMTPEKSKNMDKGEDSQSSIGNLLDYVNCQSERRRTPPYNAPVEPACRSFLEETSVDFIQKFKELASTMEGQSSSS